MEAHKIKPTGGIYGEEIAVTATPQEWRAVIDAVNSSYAESDESSRLVYWLINQGVYE